NNPFVGTNGVAPEIWALGLRHPSRLSFDRFTGDLWIGEVGQDLFDEVNLQPAGTGGLNYLWKQLEGNHNYSPGTATSFGLGTPPLLEHPRGETDLALVGGAVCGAGTYPRLTGKYLYGDLNSGTIYLVARNGDHWSKRAYPGLVGSVGAIGMDDGGDLYLGNYRSGRIYRVTDPGMVSEFRLTRQIPEPGTSLFKLRFPIDPGVAYQLETFDSGRWSPVGSPITRPLGGDSLMEYSEAIPPGRVRATRVFRVRRFGVRLPGQP
ncbi:MAG TPA: PQQ-dependent sugar dehydrogenase, partial [Candidatus Limnocylindria bacterium]|nr:PQQ-dependent sugar dehydrogenase [Candidatus Limnocylindria bacterium]